MTRAKRAQGESGFTLAELLVALAVAACVLALVVPVATRWRAGLELDRTAYDIAADLRGARATAQRTNIAQALVLDVRERRFWTHGSAQRRAIPPRFALAVDVPESERLDSYAGTLRFFPDGSASGGSVVLRDGDRTASVSVDHLTGDVRVLGSR